MVFVIFMIIALILTAWFTIWLWTDDFIITWLAKILWTILGVPFVAAICFGGLGLASWGLGWIGSTQVYVGDSDQDLKALATKDTVEGRMSGGIFASYGYIDGVRVLSYIVEQEDGGFRLGYIPASDSAVYEDDSKPRVVTHHFETGANWWFFPTWFGPLATAESYSVHVPVGSVVDGYSVEP